MTIYMIVYVSRDDDRYTSETIDEELGYYTSFEAAQAWVDKVHDYDNRYARYVEAVKSANEKRQTEFEVRRDVWDQMKAKGVDPGFFRPERTYMVEPVNFELWKIDAEMYRVIEVQPA